MQISAPSSINFEANNGYYISKKARSDAQTLLMLMKKSTEHKVNPVNSEWQTEILSTLSMKNRIKFSNSRLFIRATNDPEKNKKIPDCTLIIGKNNCLNINSETGEVLSYDTGFFRSLKGLIRKADKYLKEFLDNFNDSNVVKRNTFKTGGYIELI